MNTEHQAPISFWKTVRILLGASRKRATGRRERAQELLQHRSKSSSDWSSLGTFFAVLLMLFLNGAAVFVLNMAVEAAQRSAVEGQGKLVVSSDFMLELKRARDSAEDRAAEGVIITGDQSTKPEDHPYDQCNFAREARYEEEEYGGSKSEIEKALREEIHNHGIANLISNSVAAPGLSAIATTGRLPAMFGSLVLIWWMTMLAFQGEGLELDVQRRRHPMWEFLFSHPVPAGAVFFAEMLSPIAANPVYWGGPLFAAILYGFVYDVGYGILAGVLVGVPVTIAVACVGKALEIAVTLRFPPRTRGAVIGFMSWVGYASMMLFFFGLALVPRFVHTVASPVAVFTVMPWPWLRIFLGGQPDGSFLFLAGMFAAWLFSIFVVAGSVWFSVWGTQRGLTGSFDTESARVPSSTKIRFGKDPLYRKELLWFIRDRSAVVQAILVPITIAGFQIFNLRGLLSKADGEWNYLCGAGILFGTYFLWILGPKSLTSEGTALWISLTWPRGLESLLKAKAWLWSMISTGLVTVILIYAAWRFPADTWKVALVGVGWFLFARSMAEKTVTLVTVTSSSGEPERPSKGRMWAAQLGMLTFSIGIITQQWNLALVGLVYSFITAAAMWQNFRARLPYLYDPWSEQLPPPPTLMHAMIAISILVEGTAVVTAIMLAAAGRDSLAITQAFAYAVCAIAVAVGTQLFLTERDVFPKDIWSWRNSDLDAGAWWRCVDSHNLKFFGLIMVGAALGIVLGLFAHGYMFVMQLIPSIAELFQKSVDQMSKIPNLKVAYSVMAIGFAPFAEEYLFRGLLFRALDREWGGWQAVVGSAAFFAIYHPTLSWLPVFTLGVGSALLFKKTGRLAPAVALHMAYNAVVLLM